MLKKKKKRGERKTNRRGTEGEKDRKKELGAEVGGRRCRVSGGGFGDVFVGHLRPQ